MTFMYVSNPGSGHLIRDVGPIDPRSLVSFAFKYLSAARVEIDDGGFTLKLIAYKARNFIPKLFAGTFLLRFAQCCFHSLGELNLGRTR